MKRTLLTCTIVAAAASLGALPSAQAAPQKHHRVAASNSTCVADQRPIADAIDQNPAMGPEMRRLAKEMRTRCLPNNTNGQLPASWYMNWF